MANSNFGGALHRRIKRIMGEDECNTRGRVLCARLHARVAEHAGVYVCVRACVRAPSLIRMMTERGGGYNRGRSAIFLLGV